MPRPKRTVPAGEELSPIRELDRKIQYHRDCIEKLQARRARLCQPSRKQMTELLSKVEGMTMEEIAAKLGVSLSP